MQCWDQYWLIQLCWQATAQSSADDVWCLAPGLINADVQKHDTTVMDKCVCVCVWKREDLQGWSDLSRDGSVSVQYALAAVKSRLAVCLGYEGYTFLLYSSFPSLELRFRESTHTIIHKTPLFLRFLGQRDFLWCRCCDWCLCDTGVRAHGFICACVRACVKNAITKRLEQMMCLPELTNTHMLNLGIKADGVFWCSVVSLCVDKNVYDFYVCPSSRLVCLLSFT